MLRVRAACLDKLCYSSGVQPNRLLRTALSCLPLLVGASLAIALANGCGGADSEVTETTVDSGGPDTSTSPDTALDDTGADLGTDTFVPTADAADTAVPDTADAGPDWPSCDTKPAAATTATIRELWTANPTAPKFSWVSGVVVTAVSSGGCAADKACQIFVQEESTETTLAGVAKRAIKVFVSAKAASRFTGIVPGDKVDVAAHAWRYNVDGQNELLLQVNDLTRGCMKKTGVGTIAPVAATLADLVTVDAYESTLGPVLVKVSEVTGNTKTLAQIFGLRPIGGAPTLVSLSPYCLAGSLFTGLTESKAYDFSTITGVYGMFIPGAPSDGGLSKYLVIYPRTLADLAIK